MAADDAAFFMPDFFITILLPQHNMNYEGKTKRKRR